MVKIIFLNVLFFSLLAILFCKDQINKPVVGIYGNSEPENNDTGLNGTYYPISYVYWLEQAGAQVMAIHYWYPNDLIDEILNKVNGILFLGGGRDIHKEGVWEQKAKYIMEQSLIYQLPVWGTCQGFQLIGILMSNNYTLLRYGFDEVNVLHGLNITDNAKYSTSYNLFKENDFDILENENSTIYYHHYGFYPEQFYKEKRLTELFVVTSISEDKNGLRFVDSFEGKNDSIKFYATQFHPEKNPYKRFNYPAEQNIASLKVSHLLSMSFLQETRKNKNRFDSLSNDEGDRAQFDFFDTYRGTPNGIFDKESETFYFYKKED